MPFVDLSKPIDPTSITGTPPANDFKVPNLVSPASNNAVSAVPVGSVAQAPIPVQTNPKILDDDQGLMRDVPKDLQSENAVTINQGVKEFKGPPIGDTQNLIDNKTESISNVQNITKEINEIKNQLSDTGPKPIDVLTEVNSVPTPTNLNVSANVPISVAEVPIAPSASSGQVVTSMASGQAPSASSGQVPSAASGQIPSVDSEKLPPAGSTQMPSAGLAQAIPNNSETLPSLTGGIANKPADRLKSLKPTTADEKFLVNKASISEFLSVAEQRDASDIHLSVGYPPMIRVNGTLVSLGGEAMTDERIKVLFDSILSEQQKESLKKDLDLDFSFSHTTGTRFRINIYHKKGSLGGAFRLIPSKIRTIAELNLPKVLYDLLDVPQGLIILAGPTGSGKSTTIASFIQEINMNSAVHIMTLEDPIEYIFPMGKALINQREVGNDVTSFNRGLREVLREDPDVILVGEMRDFETIANTITAAETGHLVFTTLHTNSASQTIDRIIDVFPDAQQAQVRAQLANVITAVVSQRLIPIKSGGRKAVVEIMIATPAVRNAIREAKTYQIDNMIQTNVDIGMITLEKSLLDLIRKGEITLEQAQSYTSKPDELITLMKNN